MHPLTLQRISVKNFKSLKDFDLDFAKFTCLVGLNGAGKSTVLQCLDFFAQQFKGEIQGWLKQRQWKASDLSSKLSRQKNISFEFVLQRLIGEKVRLIEEEVRWSGEFNWQQLRCTTEHVVWQNSTLLKVKDSRYDVGEGGEPIRFKYEGSILSQLKASELPPNLLEFKSFFTQLKTLEVLDPAILRQKTKAIAQEESTQQGLELGGKYLASRWAAFSEPERQAIVQRLQRAYPHLANVEVTKSKTGLCQLSISEKFSPQSLKTEARHIADGVLRLIALFTQLSQSQSLLLLDEVENGINLELIELMMDSLVAAPSQVLVTTHNPVVLNYLEDEVAKAGMIYLYKTHDGATQAIRFFDIPSMGKKLTVMGPGEAYEDTRLTELEREIEQMQHNQQR